MTQYFQKNSTTKSKWTIVKGKNIYILLVVGPNKKQLQLASYYYKNIVKLKLRWSYSSFKLISMGFKQNLGLGCLNFYFRGQNEKNLYIKILIEPG